jgi:tetratricopeptide (TPR) repeat protein
MHSHGEDAERLFREAEAYHREGDVYNAVKLYKKVIRLASGWNRPYTQLGSLYKDRADWKTCLHYTHIGLQLDPEDRDAWMNLALASTARKKWRSARQAWNRLGYDFRETDQATDFEMGVVALILNPGTQPEVVWARRLDPARAVVLSIPQPGSGHRFRDIVLFDPGTEGAQAAGAKQWPAYRELQVLKSSPFKTFSVVLPDVSRSQVDTLARLCSQERVGFDNWSAATHLYLPPAFREKPEFHLHPFPQEDEQARTLVALAAKKQGAVEKVLRNWEIITLSHYEELQFVY